MTRRTAVTPIVTQHGRRETSSLSNIPGYDSDVNLANSEIATKLPRMLGSERIFEEN